MSIARFAEILLPVGYCYGTVGGPADSVTVTETAQHREERFINADDDPCVYQLGDREIPEADHQFWLAFYRARRGRAQGFRFQDLTDYRATDEVLAPTGLPAVQLTRTYGVAGDPNPYVRNIFKPRAGAALKRDGTPVATGASPGDAAVDITTGLATFIADASEAISSITSGATTTLHLSAPLAGAAAGKFVYLGGITGDTNGVLNGQALTITAASGDDITVAVDTTGLTLAAGTAAFYPQPGETLTWSGQFDVPVRFDNATYPVRIDGVDAAGNAAYYLTGLLLREIVSADGI